MLPICLSTLFFHVFFQIQLWDTAGVERFRTLTRNYFRGACAVLFTYSTQDTDSLHNLVQFVEDAHASVPDGELPKL